MLSLSMYLRTLDSEGRGIISHRDGRAHLWKQKKPGIDMFDEPIQSLELPLQTHDANMGQRARFHIDKLVKSFGKRKISLT